MQAKREVPAEELERLVVNRPQLPIEGQRSKLASSASSPPGIWPRTLWCCTT
jgi:hypothetical protein